MDPHSKATLKLAGSASKAGSKGTARKAARKKKKRAPSTQNAGQSSGSSPPPSPPAVPSFDSRTYPEEKRRSHRSKGVPTKQRAPSKGVPTKQHAPSNRSGSGRDNLKESPTTREPKEKERSKKCCCCGSRSSGGSPCDWFLSLFGLKKQSKVDDFVVFDDSSSMEQSLLWSKHGNQPTAEDYLEFVKEHERGLADHASNLAVPKPPEDKCDY